MPPSSTSSPAAFSGNARPVHVTALSGKVHGLKFMQRAAAVQQQAQRGDDDDGEGNAAKASASTSKNAKAKKEESNAASGSSAAAAAAAPALVASVDGNEEHWSFAPSASIATEEDTASSSNAQGWDSWLLSRSSRDGGSASSSSRTAQPSTSALGAGGRRKFGRFQGEVDPEEEEAGDGDEQDEGDSRRNRGRSSNASSLAGKRRKRGEGDAPSLEPDFDQDDASSNRRRPSSSSSSAPSTMRNQKSKRDRDLSHHSQQRQTSNYLQRDVPDEVMRDRLTTEEQEDEDMRREEWADISGGFGWADTGSSSRKKKSKEEQEREHRLQRKSSNYSQRGLVDDFVKPKSVVDDDGEEGNAVLVDESFADQENDDEDGAEGVGEGEASTSGGARKQGSKKKNKKRKKNKAGAAS